jgi:hypothetical protein
VVSVSVSCVGVQDGELWREGDLQPISNSYKARATNQQGGVEGAEVRSRGGRLTGLISSKALAISTLTLACTLNAADPHLQEDGTDEDKDLLLRRYRRGGASGHQECGQRGVDSARGGRIRPDVWVWWPPH